MTRYLAGNGLGLIARVAFMSWSVVADSAGAMASNDSDLDKLTSLLSQCLGRIDEEAYRLQMSGDDVDFDTADRIEDETATLQELVDSLLVVDMGSDETDVNRVVSRIAEACLQEIVVPVVLRTNLTRESSLVAAPSALVTVAVQRAMVLAISPLGPGDELRLTTRIEGGSVVFEVESLGSHPDDHAAERAQTLCDFVAEFGGSCNVRSEGFDLYMVIELPQVMATNRSESF